MNCPICNNNKVELKTEFIEREFRNENYKVYEQYYFCNKCKNDFTTSEQDDVAVNQVYNQYREKYNIPFPEELKQLRKNYKLSASKMAEILGFGTNQFRNYEAGEIPNKSNAKTLMVINNPIHFRAYIEQSKPLFKTQEFNKLLDTIDIQINKNKNEPVLKQLFSNYLTPNKFNGYKIPSFDKFFNMIIYFNDNAFFQVRLNKFLFYADFLNFKRTGNSISGIPYVAIQMGPVPERYKALMDFAEKEGYIEYGYDPSLNADSERISKKREFDYTLFDDCEIESLNIVLDNLRFKKTDELKELSHKEKAWIENIDKRNIISYLDYAFQLTAV